jgi:enhancing lycopene biosynthesis protein 2
MTRAGVVLSGCGVKDGSEIHEAVCTLLALSRLGVETNIFAPDIPQAQVINHTDRSILAGETRNVLVESARIARGQIKDLAQAKVSELDAVIFPGGLGAVKNLCTFDRDGFSCQVNDQVERIINEMYDARKPIGALCIAPVIIAKVLSKRQIRAKITIGNEKKLAQEIEQVGFCHIDCSATDCVVDETHKIVTTPCYMLAGSIDQVFLGASRLVEEVLRLI